MMGGLLTYDFHVQNCYALATAFDWHFLARRRTSSILDERSKNHISPYHCCAAPSASAVNTDQQRVLPFHHVLAFTNTIYIRNPHIGAVLTHRTSEQCLRGRVYRPTTTPINSPHQTLAYQLLTDLLSRHTGDLC